LVLSTYGLPHSWNQRYKPTCLVCWLRWGTTNFSPVLPSNLNPPYFYFPGYLPP
jgi:hypothetical protein